MPEQKAIGQLMEKMRRNAGAQNTAAMNIWI